VPRFLGVDYDAQGRPVKPTTRRVGTTSREFAQKHSLGMIRVETDNEEILGYLLREDLAGVRVAHGVHERSQYGQARRLRWVIDDVPFYNIRKIRRLD
jgi:hypothetical protein